MKIKEFIVAVAFVFLSLLIYTFFPAKDTFQQVITTLFFLVVLPLLFSKYILKNTKDIINFDIGDYKQGLIHGAISLVACLFIIFILSYFYNFLNRYAVPIYITKSFTKFLAYEFLLVLSFVVVYEFYFRGFLVGIFNKKIGYWSILLQFIVFGLLVNASFEGKNIIQYMPYLIFAPFGGWIALGSRSLIYSTATQFILIFILNVLVIHKLG